MVIRSLNTDRLAQQFSQASPFSFVRIDEFLDREFAREFTQEVAAPGNTAQPVQRLQEALHSPEFLRTLSRITGIHDLLVDERSLAASVQQTVRGTGQAAHVDFNYLPDVKLFRRLNLLLYLNPDWQESWGGHLQLWDPDTKQCLHSLAPILGRCVIFEIGNNSLHGTGRVTCPPQLTRNAISLYYYSREAPPEFAHYFDPAVLQARASEFLKGKVLLPMETMARKVSYGTQQLMQSVKGLFRRPAPTPGRGAAANPGQGPAAAASSGQLDRLIS